MRYFIAHIIQGPIAIYHRNIVEDIATQFGTTTSAGYFPSHITLKAPFEMSDTAIVEQLLKEFASGSHAFPFKLRGFGHFDNSVIFFDTDMPHEARVAIEGLQQSLRTVPDLSWGEQEPLKNFHLTVAKQLTPEQFEKISAYLVEKHHYFEVLFDNVTLLRFEDGKWVASLSFPLLPR